MFRYHFRFGEWLLFGVSTLDTDIDLRFLPLGLGGFNFNIVSALVVLFFLSDLRRFFLLPIL